MKKKFIIFLSLLALSGIFLSIYLAVNGFHSQPAEVILAKCFNNSTARIISSEIYLCGRLDGRVDSLDELKRLAVEFSQKLGVVTDGSYYSGVVENDVIQKVETRGMTRDEKAVNISAWMDKKQGKGKDGYISVSVTQDLSNAGLKEARNVAMDVFRRYGINPVVNSRITGSLDGKLDYNSLNGICKRIFKDAGAVKVDGIADRNLISVSAYSPSIDNFIEENGKKVNLGLAVRYNAFENKTYISLATPVITVEY